MQRLGKLDRRDSRDEIFHRIDPRRVNDIDFPDSRGESRGQTTLLFGVKFYVDRGAPRTPVLRSARLA